MRKLVNIDVPKEVSANFPNGAILNETDTQDGTPVIREIYNDILVNMYKLLDAVEINATNDEDSESNQYQILDALRIFSNIYNDIEQVLTLGGNTWVVPFNLNILPNKYVFFARPTDNYNPLINYNFKGLGALEIPFSSPTGFSLNDELLIVIDPAGVRAYSLSLLTSANDTVYTTLGTPLSFNQGSKMYYFENGNLLSDTPSVNYIEVVLRTIFSDSSIYILDMMILQGYLLCFVYSESNEKYKFYQFNVNDFDTPEVVNFDIDDLYNYYPYCFTDGVYLYITNTANNSPDDFRIAKCSYDFDGAQIVGDSEIVLDNTFEKTSNTIVKNNKIYTLIDGVLNAYDLISGIKSEVGVFNGINGQLIMFNGSPYFCSGEVAQKWTL